MKKSIQKQTFLKRRILSIILVFVMLFSVVSPHIIPMEKYQAATGTGVYAVGSFNNWTQGDPNTELTHLWGDWYYGVFTFEPVSEDVTLKLDKGIYKATIVWTSVKEDCISGTREFIIT